jgi:hypothetical protein
MLDTKYLYSCKHCGRKFMKEQPFMKHECQQMLRSREVQTAVGQQAYALYKVWLEKQRRKSPPPETFIGSTFYTGFYKFAQFTRATGINDPELYVDLMVKEGLSPTLWRGDEAYRIYIEYIDKKLDPYKQAEATIKVLDDIALQKSIDVSQVFSTLRFGEVLSLISKKHLSPWLLLCSNSFRTWVKELDKTDQEMLMLHMGWHYWRDALEKQPAVVKDMQEIAMGLGI